MKAVIADNEWVYLDGGVPSHLEAALLKRLSAKSKHAQYIDVYQQTWDGVYRKYYKDSQKFARTLLADVVEVCKEEGVPLQIDDRRPPVIPLDASLISKDMLPGITLEDYQVRTLEAVCKSEVGIIKSPTGSGKTELMAAIAKIYGKTTVIIADIRVVIEQIRERLNLRQIAGDGGVGLFYGGATPTGQKVIVGSIQSLVTPPVSLKRRQPKMYAARLKRAKMFQEIVKRAGLLMVDECDKAVSKPYRQMFKFYFRGRFKFGFSATPFDPDKPVENLILKEHMGPLLAEIGRSEVQETGRIIPIKFYMIAFGEDGNREDARTYDIAEREIVIDNSKFHDRVAQIVSAFPKDGTLILIDTSNIEDLGYKLQEKIPGSRFIYGETSKTQRNEAIEAFERRELKCLIGGRILKRGLDLQGGAENLIIIGGGKLYSNFDQKIGRAVRRNARGWARVFSFYFLNNKYLYLHSRKQLKALVGMGYYSEVVFKDVRTTGEALVRSRFRKPKPALK